jgi:proteasome accessory factor A
VDTEIEWAIKRRLIERYKERLGCALDDPRLARLEMAYHDVSPSRGVFNRLQADGLVKRIVSEQDILDAVASPPTTTRAALRGRFVTAALESGCDYTVDWVHLKISGTNPRTVLLKDPFRNVDERVDVLLAALDG